MGWGRGGALLTASHPKIACAVPQSTPYQRHPERPGQIVNVICRCAAHHRYCTNSGQREGLDEGQAILAGLAGKWSPGGDGYLLRRSMARCGHSPGGLSCSLAAPPVASSQWGADGSQWPFEGQDVCDNQDSYLFLGLHMEAQGLALRATCTRPPPGAHHSSQPGSAPSLS